MRRALIALLVIGCSDGESAGPPVAVKSTRASNVCGVLFEVQVRLGGRIHGATPDALDFGDYVLQADATFTSPGTSCNDEIARGLTALCDRCQEAPADCEPEVRALFRQVPPQCSRCGDEVCFGGESAQSCAPDCAASCGDGMCSPLELAATCPVDCAVACGDGMCTLGENPTNCPIDCRFTAGDGVCEPGETPENSPQDCGFSTCGDGFCQSYETALRCQEDCCWPRVCADGYRRCRDRLARRASLHGDLQDREGLKRPLPELMGSPMFERLPSGAWLGDTAMTGRAWPIGLSLLGAVLIGPLAVAVFERALGATVSEILTTLERLALPSLAAAVVARTGCLLAGCEIGREAAHALSVRYASGTAAFDTLVARGVLGRGAALTPPMHRCRSTRSRASCSCSRACGG